MRQNGFIVLVALGVAAGACSDAAGPTVGDAELNEAVAMVAADAAVEDVQVMRMQFVVPTASEIPTDQTVTRSRTVTFFDADGEEMDSFDAELTASIHVVSELAGEASRDGWSATIERSRDLWITGLAGSETSRTWDGTGSARIQRSRHSDDGEARTYEMSSSAVIDGVVMGVPRSEHPWPLEGTVTRSVTVTIENGPNGDEVREREVVVMFNGTRLVTMTIDGEEFEIDLSERDTRKPFRRR